MPAPDSSERGVAFDLGHIEKELQQESAYWREGHTARTLVLAPDLRVVLITIKGGSRIAEHDSSESASEHVRNSEHPGSGSPHGMDESLSCVGEARFVGFHSSHGMGTSKSSLGKTPS